MASKKKIHPSLMPNEGEAFTGFPTHGEEYYDEPDDFEVDSEEYYEEPEKDSNNNVDSRFDAMNRRLGELEAENKQLRRQIPPVSVQQSVAEPEADEEEPDWEDLFFKNPSEALRLYGDKIEKRVEKRLRGDYERERNSDNFWKRFYRKHDDLHEDHDLVLSTLNKHLAELSTMSSDEAMDELADLTRTRIMRYSGKNPSEEHRVSKKRSRAFAEGAEAPKPRKAANIVSMEGSLSNLLKKRRAKRFGRGRVA